MFDILSKSYLENWVSNPAIDLTVPTMERNVKTFSPVRQNIFAEALVSLYAEMSRQERNINQFLGKKFIASMLSTTFYGYVLSESADKKEIEFSVVSPALKRAFKFKATSAYTTGSNYMLTLVGSHSSEKYREMKPSIKTTIGVSERDTQKFKRAFGQAVLASSEFHIELEKAVQNFKNVNSRFDLRDRNSMSGLSMEKYFFVLLFKKASGGKQVMINTPMGHLNAFSAELYTYATSGINLNDIGGPKVFTCNELNLQVRYLLAHDKILEVSLNGKVISVN